MSNRTHWIWIFLIFGCFSYSKNLHDIESASKKAWNNQDKLIRSCKKALKKQPELSQCFDKKQLFSKTLAFNRELDQLTFGSCDAKGAIFTSKGICWGWASTLRKLKAYARFPEGTSSMPLPSKATATALIKSTIAGSVAPIPGVSSIKEMSETEPYRSALMKITRHEQVSEFMDPANLSDGLTEIFRLRSTKGNQSVLKDLQSKIDMGFLPLIAIYFADTKKTHVVMVYEIKKDTLSITHKGKKKDVDVRSLITSDANHASTDVSYLFGANGRSMGFRLDRTKLLKEISEFMKNNPEDFKEYFALVPTYIYQISEDDEHHIFRALKAECCTKMLADSALEGPTIDGSPETHATEVSP